MPTPRSPDAPVPSSVPDVETDAPGSARATRARRRRLLLWTALVALLVAVQGALLWLTWKFEQSRLQETTDAAAAAAATDVRQRLSDVVQTTQQLLWLKPQDGEWWQAAQAAMQRHREIMRIEARGPDFKPLVQASSPFHPGQFTSIPRTAMLLEAETACANARRHVSPTFSRSYFVPMGSGLGLEMVDLCLPQQADGRPLGSIIATVVLSELLSQSVPDTVLRHHEVLLVEADGTRLARAGARRGAGAYTAERLVDLAGLTLPLRLDSTAATPGWIPNLSAALVLALSVALSGVVLLLGYDVRRRARAEHQLAEALAMRRAMEESLFTGLRARDLRGHETYVNAAFCAMVGYSAQEILAATTPLYWPPEHVDEYRQRQALRLAARDTPPREGHETVFMRRNGERFPVLIFEAPLVDGRGRQTGWMSSVLDISAQRRAEELSRQQQDKLQAATRLATLGEMATLLSHELNQPLAAIASYAGGSLNLLPASANAPAADLDTQLMVRQACERMAEQADRAGRVIRSVHQFVRRRERLHEPVRADLLIEAVLPLIRLAARRSQTRVEIELPRPVPRVSCDRTMVEQVLLNLARNGIQAMEESPMDAAERVLWLRVLPAAGRWVEWQVEDHGPGITPEVGQQLFTPFFTTRAEGMGMGLAMCRTVIEQHGGALDYVSPVHDTRPHGTRFRFTLAVATSTAAGTPTPNEDDS